MSLLQLSILMADSLCYPKDVLSSLGTIACVCRFLVDSYVNESRSTVFPTHGKLNADVVFVLLCVNMADRLRSASATTS